MNFIRKSILKPVNAVTQGISLSVIRLNFNLIMINWRYAGKTKPRAANTIMTNTRENMTDFQKNQQNHVEFNKQELIQKELNKLRVEIRRLHLIDENSLINTLIDNAGLAADLLEHLRQWCRFGNYGSL